MSRQAAILSALVLTALALAAWLLLDAKPPAMQSYNLALGWESKRRAFQAGAEYVALLLRAA